MFKEDDGTRGDTLCERCQNACGRCEWSDKLQPIGGWVAIKTNIKRHHKRSETLFESYRVLRCPLFRADDERHTKTILYDRTMLLIERIAIQAVKDYAYACYKAQTDSVAYRLNHDACETRRWLLSPVAEDMFYSCGVNIEPKRLVALIEADPLGVLERIKINYEGGNVESDDDDE